MIGPIGSEFSSSLLHKWEEGALTIRNGDPQLLGCDGCESAQEFNPVFEPLSRVLPQEQTDCDSYRL